MDTKGQSKVVFEVSEMIPIGFSELWIRHHVSWSNNKIICSSVCKKQNCIVKKKKSWRDWWEGVDLPSSKWSYLSLEEHSSYLEAGGTWMLDLMLLFLHFSYMEALLYLIYAYQNNKELLSKGPYRGHDEELISHYRRECLLVSEGGTICLKMLSLLCSSNKID